MDSNNKYSQLWKKNFTISETERVHLIVHLAYGMWLYIHALTSVSAYIKTWMNNFILYKLWDAITYLYLNLRWTLSSKEDAV